MGVRAWAVVASAGGIVGGEAGSETRKNLAEVMGLQEGFQSR